MATLKSELIYQDPVTIIWSAQPSGTVAGAADLSASTTFDLSEDGSMSSISIVVSFSSNITDFGFPLMSAASPEDSDFLIGSWIFKFKRSSPFQDFFKFLKLLPRSF